MRGPARVQSARLDSWAGACRDLLSASVRHINTRPDTRELLAGKEQFVFAALTAAANAAITEDGADIIVIGSTTMYQSHAHLAATLPCPVVNPGLAAYNACETLLDLSLAHSKLAYPSPQVINDDLFQTIAPAQEGVQVIRQP